MGLYNFMPRFVPKIRSGEKQHTIRAERRYPDEPGDTMHLYCGLRTRSVELIMRAPCVRVEPIEIVMIKSKGHSALTRGLEFPHIIIAGVDLSPDEIETFARRDGFESFADMLGFWNGRLPFRGQVYHWRKTA